MLRAPMERTPPDAPGLPGGRRALVGCAVAAGVAVAAVAAYDVRAIVRLRRNAPSDPAPLDHTALVGEGLAEPLDLVVLGDSAAAGYGNGRPEDAFPFQVGTRVAQRLGARVRIASVAASGATTRHVARDQVPTLRAHAPDLVVVSVGVNDALGRRRSATVRAHTAGLLEGIADAAPRATTVLVGCPDLSTAPGLPWPLNLLIGWRCRRVRAAQGVAATEAGAGFVAHPFPPEPEHFGPDGLHPGPAGQAAVAAVVDASGSLVPARDRTQEDRWTSA